MARIAREGPRFKDLVLEHAELLPTDRPGDPVVATAYNYVPSSVLGDWQYDVEPNWLAMQQMPLLKFYQVGWRLKRRGPGLRERGVGRCGGYGEHGDAADWAS